MIRFSTRQALGPAKLGGVGLLIPSDFDVETLESSERRVITALADGTDDAWLILPTVPFVDRGRDGEADVVLLNPTYGAVVLEVKGGRITVHDGRWFQDDRPLKRSPAEQAVAVKHTLLRKVLQVRGVEGTDRIFFKHAVAFPDAAAVPAGSLGPNLEPEMVLTSSELQWPEEALHQLMHDGAPASPAAVEATVRALRPDLEFSDALGPQLVAVSRRLDARTEDVLRTAEALDANLRVWVEGPAGSGKTRLALRWARRAEKRGERVLLLCFNRPMAAYFALQFEDVPKVVAGGFHDVAIRWLEPTGFEVPYEPTADFWENMVPEAFIARRSMIDVTFDTVILDEVQDIGPAWLPAIEGLLDPNGARRLYRLGDSTQNVYRVVRDESEGWVRFPLSTNCRNTRSIARVAARLGGGDTFGGSPIGPPVIFVPVGGRKEVLKRVGSELTTLLRRHRVPPSSIAVITTRADLRDAILASSSETLKLARWDERDETAIVCETAHRLKGTEWQAVVVSSLEPTDSDWLPAILYVAVSRATTWLSVVAPRDTGQLLGIATG
jgi:hypothetical protein